MEEFTHWTESLEVFVEFPVLRAEVAARMVYHLTDLDTGKPVSASGLELIFRRETQEHRQPLELGKSGAPGVYFCEVKFSRPGTWSQQLSNLPEALGNLVELPDIRVHSMSEMDPADDDDDDNNEEADVAIVMHKEDQWALGLRMAPVAVRDLTSRIRLPARVETPPGRYHTVLAPISGDWIAIPESTLEPGDWVEAGTPLLQLQPAGLEDALQISSTEQRWQQASNALELARKNRDRTIALHRGQARSERELQEVEAAWRHAVAEESALRNLRESLRLASTDTADGPVRLDIVAPGSGFVEERHAGPGTRMEKGSPLLTLRDAREVWLRVAVPESVAFTRQAPADDLILEFAKTRSDTGPRFVPLEALGGRLLSDAGSVSERTRTTPFLYSLPNEERQFRSGETRLVHLALNTVPQTPSIRRSAVLDELGQAVVYVQLTGESFERRLIQTGIRDGDWIEVIQGLAPGERVVVSGSTFVRLTSLSNAIPDHDHDH